jgi:hypothetical protein
MVNSLEELCNPWRGMVNGEEVLSN